MWPFKRKAEPNLYYVPSPSRQYVVVATVCRNLYRLDPKSYRTSVRVWAHNDIEAEGYGKNAMDPGRSGAISIESVTRE